MPYVGRRRAPGPPVTVGDGTVGKRRAEVPAAADRADGLVVATGSKPGLVPVEQVASPRTVSAQEPVSSQARLGPLGLPVHVLHDPVAYERGDDKFTAHIPTCTGCLDCVALWCRVEWNSRYVGPGGLLEQREAHAAFDGFIETMRGHGHAVVKPVWENIKKQPGEAIVAEGCNRTCLLTLCLPRRFALVPRPLHQRPDLTLGAWATMAPPLPPRPDTDVATQVARRRPEVASAPTTVPVVVPPTVAVQPEPTPPPFTQRAPEPVLDLNASLLDAARAEADSLRASLAAAHTELAAVRAQIDDAFLDATAAHDDRRRAEAELRALQARLVAAGWYDQANEVIEAEPDPVPLPCSFRALVDQAPLYEALGVHLTAPERDRVRLAEDLDSRDTGGEAAANAWEVLLTLADYRRAKHDGTHAGNLYNYLETPPYGYRTVGLAKFASNESAATMEAFGEDRDFAVPKSLFSSGTCRMTAHFRLGRVGGMQAPRLYLFDHTHSGGDIYVGYIGPHLRNRQTN